MASEVSSGSERPTVWRTVRVPSGWAGRICCHEEAPRSGRREAGERPERPEEKNEEKVELEAWVRAWRTARSSMAVPICARSAGMAGGEMRSDWAA